MGVLPHRFTFPVRSISESAPRGRSLTRLPSLLVLRSLTTFSEVRSELNEEILNCGHLGIKRAFALDHQAYEAGALDTKTKELLGLVGSMVLQCDDGITYHLVRAAQLGWSRAEVIDALNVALVVGGSITVPHIRRAFARMREVPGLKPDVK